MDAPNLFKEQNVQRQAKPRWRIVSVLTGTLKVECGTNKKKKKEDKERKATIQKKTLKKSREKNFFFPSTNIEILNPIDREIVDCSIDEPSFSSYHSRINCRAKAFLIYIYLFLSSSLFVSFSLSRDTLLFASFFSTNTTSPIFIDALTGESFFFFTLFPCF